MKLYSNDYLKITVMPLGMTRSTSDVFVRTTPGGFVSALLAASDLHKKGQSLFMKFDKERDIPWSRRASSR